MREVFLTVGPQGAGKSTWCRMTVRLCPKIIHLEREKFLREKLGPRWGNPYIYSSEDHDDVLLDKVAAILAPDNVRLLLDCWTWNPEHRRCLASELRDRGADFISALVFTTAEDIVVRQYAKRESRGNGKLRTSLEADGRKRCRDHRFHPVTLEQGFDEIQEIDPYQLTLFPWPEIVL